MIKKEWWKDPTRVIQYNLQVKDTPLMNPEQLARQTQELGANAVVMNVGGIYAWYDSKVPYHHINEYLPADRDLLKELIDAFHGRDICFIARFDFSIADDVTYLKKPQWFARKKDRQPYYRGEKRMGNWSLFLNTCALGGYRNEEVAVPVMREVLGRYEIDGVFLNAPHPSACFCPRCQEKYRSLYGKEMPETEEEFEDGWYSECMKENIASIYGAIKESGQDVPLILYYAPFSTKTKSFGRSDRDSIYDRYQTADLICTESQNVLSNGIRQLPDTIHPVLAMKAGQLPGREKLPFGIIHSCPGMDWRHVGMPAAEYLPWMAQVPASGGVLWHSLTGFPETIPDKRILKAVRSVNGWIKKTEKEMQGAQYRSNVLLLWNGDQTSRGWAEAFIKNHVQFDLMQDYELDAQRLGRYPLAVVPGGFRLAPETASMLLAYAQAGGKVVVESVDEDQIGDNAALYGVQKEVCRSEYLCASYLRFEESGIMLRGEMDTDRIAMRGEVCYCRPETAQVLATLIPPFAPYEAVGAPPERASIPVPRTDLPLVLLQKHGKGSVVLLTFSLSRLITEYRLSDHYELVKNLTDGLLGEHRDLDIAAPRDVQVTVYEKPGQIMIHFVNETGQRPLLDPIPIYGMGFSLWIGQKRIRSVYAAISGVPVSWEVRDGYLKVSLDKAEVWEMAVIQFEEDENETDIRY